MWTILPVDMSDNEATRMDNEKARFYGRPSRLERCTMDLALKCERL